MISGCNSGTQPEPGFYAALFYYTYDTDTILDADGDRVTPAPGNPGSVGVTATAPIIWWVSKAKLFGANYGVMAVLPWANSSIEAPAFGFEDEVGSSFADAMIRPLDLGWHTKRTDVNAGLQIYAPTGKYELGGDDNIGKGMWTYEPFVGATFYFDQERTFSFATTAYWEFHDEKKDTDIKVGQILTLEGGLGKSFLGGGLIVGAAYYGQWKMTEDEVGTFPLPGGGTIGGTLPGKHEVLAYGPDVTLPIATKSKLIALVNIRYLWETGATREDGRGVARRHGDLPYPEREAAVKASPMHRMLKSRRRLVIVSLAAALLTATPVSAQDSDAAALAKAAQNPIADMISLPFQNNTNFDVGPLDKTQNILNIQPVWPVNLNKEWNLITRTIMPVISQPAFAADQDRENGIGDIQFSAFFSPKKVVDGWVWGVGPIAQLDTATDERLGQGAWGLGPTAVALHLGKTWVYGALINNVWSVSEDEGRQQRQPDAPAAVRQLQLSQPPGRYLTFAPIITADWEAESGQRWTLPLGLGIGQITRFGKQPVNLQASAYYNIERPDDAANWQLRLQLQLLFPK